MFNKPRRTSNTLIFKLYCHYKFAIVDIYRKTVLLKYCHKIEVNKIIHTENRILQIQ